MRLRLVTIVFRTESELLASAVWAGFSRRARIAKAEPVARLECLTATQDGSFREWKRRDSTTGTEDLRCLGRSLGTCID